VAEPTDADRDRAAGLLDLALSRAGARDAHEAIARALADERARAVAPFLALADNIEDLGDLDGSSIADDIREAAQEDPK
jgi:hypothetical protein